MGTNNGTREVTLHLLLAERQSRTSWGRVHGDVEVDDRGNSLRIVSATIEPPTTRPKGTALVALKVRVPVEVFREQRISAIVDVPADMVELPEPDVEIEVTHG